jgi:hypothetical protein
MKPASNAALRAVLLACGLVSGAAAAGATEAPRSVAAGAEREWNFEVLLDGKPIGRHRFTVNVEGDRRTVVSQADFAVRILGIPAYRYRHRATEQWRGDCLNSLESRTDDGGETTEVRSARQGERYEVSAPAPASAEGCVMSYAYWNPAIRDQKRLLNAQTGRIDPVTVSRMGSGSVPVQGRPVAATQYRIAGPNPPVDLWLGPQGDWVGLDAEVRGGRRLSYRLQ